MNDTIFEKGTKFFRWSLLIGALSYIAAYLFVVVSRINYPFELIWLEGAYVDHVRRIASGLKYYVEPSIEFVSSIYTPFFFYIAALLSKIIGAGFFPLRSISVLSSFGTFFIIYKMVKRETESPYAGILATGLFAATFALTGSHFDIGRVDSLFLFLLMLSLYILRFYKTPVYFIFAGLVISLSFFTKQTALVVSLPIMLYCLLSNWRLGIFFVITVLLLLGGGSLFMDWIHNGWFNFYVFELPRTTPVNNRIILTFWPKDILMPLGIAFSFGMVYLLFLLSEKERDKFYFYIMLISGVIMASWYSRYRIGYANVMFPTYAVMAVLFGLGFHKALLMIDSFSEEKRKSFAILLYMICIAQFCSGSLVYKPFDQIPTAEDLRAGKQFIDKISKIDGEIFIFNHGYLSVMAGKKSYANIMGARDVFLTDMKKHASIKEKLITEFEQALRENKFNAVVLDSVETCGVPGYVDYYTFNETLFKDDNSFIPVTGTKTRPDLMYVPKDSASGKM